MEAERPYSLTMIPAGRDPAPEIMSFALEGYKAFGSRADIELGRITLLLGRNNAGKTALCFAPLFLTHSLKDDADAPFPTSTQGVDFGPLQSVSFRRQPTGLVGELNIKGLPGLVKLRLGATALPEQSYAQFVTTLELEKSDGNRIQRTNIDWAMARALIHDISAASRHQLAEQVRVLRGVRPAVPRHHQYLGHVPDSVGPFGELAPMILTASGEEGLRSVNAWFEPMHIQLRIEQGRDAFELLASGTGGEPVNLVDSGAGISHILPLIVSVRLARSEPTLFCIEQPELHLHPRAHVAVAELLLECLTRQPHSRLLVETHSDVLVLRLRREIASGRLSRDDIRIYFVDEEQPGGSRIRKIELDERGTPTWWPKDVFAEPQKEYFAIRREIARRG